jgi:hypothetical protein
MKVQIAYDVEGRVLTALPRAGTKSEPKKISAGAPQGAQVGEFDIPKEFEGKHLHEFVHLLRVDVTSTRLTIISTR